MIRWYGYVMRRAIEKGLSENNSKLVISVKTKQKEDQQKDGEEGH